MSLEPCPLFRAEQVFAICKAGLEVDIDALKGFRPGQILAINPDDAVTYVSCREWFEPIEDEI